MENDAKQPPASRIHWDSSPSWYFPLKSVTAEGGRGVWGRIDTCICVAEALPCLPETTEHCLLISYTPIQNRKLKKKKTQWLSRIFSVGLGTYVHLLPRMPTFLIKTPWLSTDSCFSNYWFVSGEQLNLSLVRKSPVWACSESTWFLK